jgi:polar amino acid transport system substrate-binding protein
LSAARVGAVAGTSTEDSLSRLRIPYRKFASAQDGLHALRAHSLDAFVYDRPLLAWIIKQGFSSSIELVDTTFGSEEYAFVLSSNSPLRKSLNVAILDAVHSEWWGQTTFRYLGPQ